MRPPRSTKELFADAISDLPDDISINAACYRAVQEYEAFQQANTESDYDKAYSSYIRALTLVVERIPSSSAYRDFCQSASDDYHTYQDLRKLISADPSISLVREKIDQRQRDYKVQNQQDAPANPESPSICPDDLVQRFEKLKGHSRRRPSGPRNLRSRGSSIIALSSPNSNAPSPDIHPDYPVIPPPINPPPAPPTVADAGESSIITPSISFPQTIQPVAPLNFPSIPPLSAPPIPRTNRNYDLASHVANGSSSSSTSTSTSTSATTVNPHHVPMGMMFPKTSVINAETLHNYLSTIPDSILIADIRRRYDFDMAHLRHRHILCIDPSLLYDGMKDSDLQKVVEESAPPEEVSLFSQRDQYELIVYYDKDSASRQENFALPLFNSAVYLNAFKHPLRRAPCFLVGGLEAWVELLGVNGVQHNSSPSFLAQPETNNFRPSSPNVHPPDWPRQHTRNASSALGFYETKAESKDKYASGFRTPPPGGANGVAYDDGPSEYSDIEVNSRGRLPRRLDELASRAFRPSSQPNKTRKKEEAAMAARDKYSRDVNDYFQQLSITPPPSSVPPASGPFSSAQYNGNNSHYHSHPDAPMRPPPPIVPMPAPPNVSTSSLSRLNNISAKIGSYHLHNRNGGRDYQQVAPNFQSNFYHQPVQPHSDAITGLKNLGNSCYMNSIIQCLAGSLPLAYIFLDNSYKEYINSKSVLGSRGEFAHMFARLMCALYSEGHPYVVPVSFKQISGRLRPDFAGYEQQDAQEFLTFTLDELHEDLNVNGGRPRLRPLTEEEERKREGLSVRFASFIEWQRYLKSDQSIIVDLFQGQYMSRLRCTHCKFTSTTYNPFSFLTLPIPSAKKTTLIDCFNVFVEKETLEGSNGWNCPECKKKRKAKKSLSLSRLPQILIIQLKRFQNYGDRSDKIETLVDFPLDKLDLTKYWPPYSAKDKDWLKEHPEPSQQPPFVYRLYAVTNHFGTLKGGHYTALVRKGSKGWWLFDDTRAVPIYQNVVSANAYILFYVRDMPGSVGSF